MGTCVCVCRNCWRVVRREKEKSKMAWRSCSACPRGPTMPCILACWKVFDHTHPGMPASTYVCAWYDWLSCVRLGFDENIESQGELILQDSFQVWDPKTLIRKGRERHLFLFEMSLVFSKEVKDSNGRSKYIYKSKLFVRVLSGPHNDHTISSTSVSLWDLNVTWPCVWLDLGVGGYRTRGGGSV